MSSENWRTATRLLHEAPNRTEFGETSEALFLTSGFVYDSAEQAAATFTGDVQHFQYSRFGNPTVDTLQERLALLEGAEACVATSTGMGAVSSAILSHVKAGDRVVASRAIFGSCYWIVTNLLPRYGIETELVDGTDYDAWERALSKPTAAVLIESPSNPMLDVLDIARVAELTHKAGGLLIVDNVFATPLGQSPLKLGADVIVYSCTKHIDGQGRVLGGAVLGSSAWINETLQPYTRNTGNALSPFNAWVLLKGLETLQLRTDAMARNAAAVADALAELPGVVQVRYPGRADHPQHELAKAQMSNGGSMVAFVVDKGREGAFAFMNAFKIIAISNNLGDARSLATHPATTTHMRVSEDERARLGITDGAIRLSVGLEDPADLIDDLKRGAAAVAALA
ncbi:O-succinylhomoserine sulfhydrylase [Gluconobacter sphaericus]|uniref:O-succinylhomoserine sulfhydrylase n=1 Tax=Gluconobacter sphaericus NBRC 12467 TaxID=1307951 RepID=A0AA37SGG8_9PROT|nr:O-succinylhomoserine sulfhydrylase [Gluconobacter sphaericus]MBF0884622.1 O-succinylhomoserine sulfhydrylase [Gluconobacter sphaericus]GBR53626.1 O-succinylhomoserine sulfhydrylase [Gluconobacter sphaericus NBRC 12467]GEB41362.1 O-succinylhomoserine sulfhydrylase [Gluconobacter sphaericus NBRC 12467]GLQ83472.1 O-succinylhomoserine sulfhydrylase [Gluconobacter sphaericus NBRC 12467]